MSEENDLSGLDFAVGMMREGDIKAQLKAAQSELAALREELASRNEVIAMKAREVLEAQTAVSDWARKCRASEQRNAVLTKILGDIRENSEDIWACECAADALADALKPTESGASE